MINFIRALCTITIQYPDDYNLYINNKYLLKHYIIFYTAKAYTIIEYIFKVKAVFFYLFNFLYINSNRICLLNK